MTEKYYLTRGTRFYIGDNPATMPGAINCGRTWSMDFELSGIAICVVEIDQILGLDETRVGQIYKTTPAGLRYPDFFPKIKVMLEDTSKEIETNGSFKMQTHRLGSGRHTLKVFAERSWSTSMTDEVNEIFFEGVSITATGEAIVTSLGEAAITPVSAPGNGAATGGVPQYTAPATGGAPLQFEAAPEESRRGCFGIGLGLITILAALGQLCLLAILALSSGLSGSLVELGLLCLMFLQNFFGLAAGSISIFGKGRTGRLMCGLYWFSLPIVWLLVIFVLPNIL